MGCTIVESSAGVHTNDPGTPANPPAAPLIGRPGSYFAFKNSPTPLFFLAESAAPISASQHPHLTVRGSGLRSRRAVTAPEGR